MIKSAIRQIETCDDAEITVEPAFTERPVWRGVGDGWRHLHGSVRGTGVSFEWHDFKTHGEFNWGNSFHPGSIEALSESSKGMVGLHSTTAKPCFRP